MPPIKWPRMTLLGRIALFLAVFGAAIALQIGIGYYQSKYVLEPLERRSESIQTISQFLNDVEGCMAALENYRWDYGDAAALIASIQSSREHSAGHLALIRADLGAVSEEQYLLASAARTTYGTLDLTLDAITEELRSGRPDQASRLYYGGAEPCGAYLRQYTQQLLEQACSDSREAHTRLTQLNETLKRAQTAVVSMDNCSHNGETLRRSVMTVVEQWLKRGFVTPEFAVWVANENQVSFPWSMIDKITPRPAQAVEETLAALGVEDMAPIVTSKNTFIAPFVNAERPQYLVVEDRFPNGRPPLEQAGVYMTDRDTVNRTEKMKVTTCLNPLHTALAVYGCLLGYRSIAEEMKDPQLKALVERIGYDEGIPVVVDPKILSPMDFIREVIEQRLPNPFIPDMPQRIATDTSQKVPIRFGETIKSYVSRPDLDVTDLTYIPLAIAGWLRYLLAADDNCKPMECSSDPMLDTLQKQLSGVRVGDPASASDGALAPILSNPALFAVDLCQVGLAGKIGGMLREMLTGPGAVRRTLESYLTPSAPMFTRQDQRWVFHRDTLPQPAGAGVVRRVLAYNSQLMCVENTFETGAVGALHTHPHTQITYVASGRFSFTIDGETHEVGQGDTLLKTDGVEHGCTCLEAGVLLDIFNPMREDFLPG